MTNPKFRPNRRETGLGMRSCHSEEDCEEASATSLGRACVHGVHFTRAWAREASDAERRRWITTQRLSAPGQPKEQDFGI